ncbi:MAG: DUF521 domain-containing protein, partial [Thermoplasmata archaeon]|nr:DUF521 domain-containing protein [Thermoplasmata archaeon]
MPASGSVTICHIVGLTPEAPTLEQALGGAKPLQWMKVGEKEVKEAWEQLHTADSREVDLVSIGCPHCTILELGEIASILDGKKLSSNTSLLLGVARPVVTLASQMGYTDIIEQAGGKIVADTCMVVAPIEDMGYKVTAVNSGKAANYLPGFCKQEVVFNNIKSLIKE